MRPIRFLSTKHWWCLRSEVGTWWRNPSIEQVISPTATQPASDFELLMAEDSFDMLQDLEFYSWIDIDAEVEAGNGADVG